MKTMRRTLIKNPHIGMAVPLLGSALLHNMQQAYPELAAEFISVFSYATDTGQVSIAAVGAEMHIEAVKEDNCLVARLRHNDRIEQANTYQLDASTPFHEQLFRCLARFIDETRTLLISHHGLAPSTLLLGGWCCVTRPEQLREALVFTIPRLIGRIDDKQYDISHFDDTHRVSVDDSLIRIPYDFAPPHLQVLQCQDIPECADYVDNLVGLLADLPADGMDKVVLAREVKLSLRQPIAPDQLLRIVSPRQNRGNYEYVFRWGDGDAWVGISPETLLRKQDDEVVVEPLAGTRKGSNASEKSDRYRQELLSDSKEREEHETAASMFYQDLADVCQPGSLSVRESRSVLDLGYVQHLKSVISGRVKPGTNVFDVLAAVYPPATIWGKPLDLCGERIRSYEKIKRGFFAGGLGFATLGDDANFALAIRTARVSGNDIHVYAGSGIVKGADPYREWLETSNKMRPFIANDFVVHVAQ